MDHSIVIKRTTSENEDFKILVAALDQSLWDNYPELQSDYWGNNTISFNPNVVIAYKDGVAVACSCFKKYDNSTIEIKRMFVSPEARGQRIAQKMLMELETWAIELGFVFSVLETLYKQSAAIAMYQKIGYVVTVNYPPYEGVESSICMKKKI